MYNEAFARAVLNERVRERDHSTFLKSLHPAEPARTRRRIPCTAPGYLRGVPASWWQAAMARRPACGDELGALADA